ncbi:MAG: PKD domain-containing protein [Deltaproteobacteria bacterium]|nr:PKD domain-containing protein [Deltaproteobacteria bacterium]
MFETMTWRCPMKTKAMRIVPLCVLAFVLAVFGLAWAESLEVKLDVKVKDGKISCAWTGYQGQDFKYYKLLRNRFPGAKYPEDGYLFYSTDPGITTYLDKNPLGGVSYYRACIVLDNGGKYYSSSVKVEMGEAPEPEDLKLEAEVTDAGNVVLTWTRFMGSDFRFYKVLRNEFPGAEYPRDGYLAVISNQEAIGHTDSDPLPGTSYYRLCAVTGTDKYYSESVKVEMGEDPGRIEVTIGAGKTFGPAPLSVVFRATAKKAGECLFRWDMGDGTVLSGAEVRHTFRVEGSYTVTVLATDRAGRTGESSMEVNVLASGNATEYAYILPYYTSRANEWTGVGLTNESQKGEAHVSIEVYDQSGGLIFGEDVGQPIPPQGQIAQVISGFSRTEGWMLIRSDAPLTGLSFFGTNGVGNYMADIPLVDAVHPALRIPHVAQDREWSTMIMVCNPNPQTVEVVLTFVGQNGVDDGSRTLEIDALGAAKISLSDIAASQGKGGSVRIVSEPGVAAFALYENLKFNGKCFSGIAAVPIESDIPTDPFE